MNNAQTLIIIALVAIAAALGTAVYMQAPATPTTAPVTEVDTDTDTAADDTQADDEADDEADELDFDSDSARNPHEHPELPEVDGLIDVEDAVDAIVAARVKELKQIKARKDARKRFAKLDSCFGHTIRRLDRTVFAKGTTYGSWSETKSLAENGSCRKLVYSRDAKQDVPVFAEAVREALKRMTKNFTLQIDVNEKKGKVIIWLLNAEEKAERRFNRAKAKAVAKANARARKLAQQMADAKLKAKSIGKRTWKQEQVERKARAKASASARAKARRQAQARAQAEAEARQQAKIQALEAQIDALKAKPSFPTVGICAEASSSCR